MSAWTAYLISEDGWVLTEDAFSEWITYSKLTLDEREEVVDRTGDTPEAAGSILIVRAERKPVTFLDKMTRLPEPMPEEDVLAGWNFEYYDSPDEYTRLWRRAKQIAHACTEAGVE